MACTCLVSAPEDSSQSLFRGRELVLLTVRLPETSKEDSRSIPVTFSSISTLKLSSMIWSGLSPAASSSSASVSTSTIIFLSGASARARSIAAVMPPQAVTWFSLIRKAS